MLRKNAKAAISIDVQLEPSGSHMVPIPLNKFDDISDAEDIDMVEPSPQITHANSREKSVEQLLQEWETVPEATDSNINDNSIQIVHMEPLYETGNAACASSPGVVIMNSQSGMVFFDERCEFHINCVYIL